MVICGSLNVSGSLFSNNHSAILWSSSKLVALSAPKKTNYGNCGANAPLFFDFCGSKTKEKERWMRSNFPKSSFLVEFYNSPRTYLEEKC